MAYDVFRVRTALGRHLVAIKAHKNAVPTDARTDAYTVSIGAWGRNISIERDSGKMKKLSADYELMRGAGDWAFVAYRAW